MPTELPASHLIGIDLGGTWFKCGLVSPEYKIIARNHGPTDPLQGPEQAADRIDQNVRALISQLPEGARLGAAGICCPGPLDHTRGVLIEPPNLSWHHVPSAEMVSDCLEMAVTLEHDAKAAALGEYHFGAGRSSKSMALIMMGKGVSAGIIVDGQVYRGEHDSAGELDHITVDADGPICRCGSNGCVEIFAAGPGIISAYQYATHIHTYSAEALAMVMDISTFVMFGDILQAGELVLAPARHALQHYTYKSVGARARIVIGELGNDAGILGAAFAASTNQL